MLLKQCIQIDRSFQRMYDFEHLFSARLLISRSYQHLHGRTIRIASNTRNFDLASQRSHESYTDCDIEHRILVR